MSDKVFKWIGIAAVVFVAGAILYCLGAWWLLMYAFYVGGNPIG